MKRILASLILLFSCSTAANDFSPATNKVKISDDLIIKTDQKVASKYPHEYANIWWQWTRTMQRENSPLLDRTGDKCDINQSGKVWFLAGGYGSSKISRACVIPADKYIFFPIINMIYWPKKESNTGCERVKNGAALNNDHLLSINVELDGRKIPEAKEYRLKSEKCFDLLGLIPEEYNAPKIFPSATDGYWLMLKPLSKGKHTLKFVAQYNRANGSFGKMSQDIEYEIEVK